MVLLRDSKLKTFFAMLGVVGGVLSIGYAEFYPYPWLHATQYSYYFGHVFLLANSLIHLWNTRNWLSYREIACGVFGPGNLTVDDIQWLRDITQSRIEAGLY